LSALTTLAVIVNYKSANLTLQAVHSVLNSDSVGPVEIAVIDNSADPEEENLLRTCLPQKADLTVNRRNMGFGAACNAVYEKYDSDCILLLNPDARLLPGSLLRMQKTLFMSDRIAAVGPQIYWDDRQHFLLPPSYFPALFFLQTYLSELSPGSVPEKILNCFWRNYAIRVWTANTPVRVFSLSGGHCLIKRKAVEKTEYLFDPKFFLYFEDTDLFLRLRKKGYRLMVEPKAGVVHYYDQCARDEYVQKRKRMAESFEIFMKKYMPNSNLALKNLLKHIKYPDQKISRKNEYHLPFSVKIPEPLQKKWLFEWSPNANFLPAAGCFGKGPVMNFSSDDWNRLSPGIYYGRIGRPDRIFAKKFIQFSWTVE